LYGGSVNPSQAEGLSHTNVDGLFVGRSALKVDQFFDIIFAVSKNNN
jgi:triosephosphate isomerase